MVRVQVDSKRLKIRWLVRMKMNVSWILIFVAPQFMENVRILLVPLFANAECLKNPEN